MCITCGSESKLHGHEQHDPNGHRRDLGEHKGHHDHADRRVHDHHHDRGPAGRGTRRAYTRDRRIHLETQLLAKNDRLAVDLRARLSRERIAAINLIGAPGAGKTTLLERTIPDLNDVGVTVIEGDQATDFDALRIAATGCRVIQVNTGPGCHLDTPMVERALDALDPAQGSLVLIENVGNLVCPAFFDLGERAKVVVMAVTEGVDKPLKYPHVFQAAAALVLTKVDLLPYLDVDVGAIVENARRIKPSLDIYPVSTTNGDGLADWCGWLRAQLWSDA